MSTAAVVGWFALGAAVSALLRSLLIERLNHEAFPFGTLLVNLTGSFVAAAASTRVPEAWSTVTAVAALGSFTTFSTFVNEVLALWPDRRPSALAYGAATTLGAVGAAFIGLGL